MQQCCAHCYGLLPMRDRGLGIILCQACLAAWQAHFAALLHRWRQCRRS